MSDDARVPTECRFYSVSKDNAVICPHCGFETTFPHDHRPDNSGLDDGPEINTPRKKPPPRSREEIADIRARAWKTRRDKYGEHGHR